VDDPSPTFPVHELCQPVDSGAAPGVSSPVVYCGTDQQVSEGFATALRIMGVGASFPVGLAPAIDSLNTEGN